MLRYTSRLICLLLLVLFSISVRADSNDCYFEVLPFGNNYYNAYISQDGNLIAYPSGSFRIYYYEAHQGDVFKLTGDGISSISLDYAVYSTDVSLFSASSMVQRGSVVSKEGFNKIIRITAPNASYIAITWNFAMNLTVCRRVISSSFTLFENLLQKNADFKSKDPILYDYIGRNNQEIVVHHDNFMRIVDGARPWVIGTNDPNNEVMDYGYISGEAQSFDDGFRINNGVLTNNKKVNVSSAFRIIKAYHLLGYSFNIDVSPVSVINNHCHIACNIVDEQTYDYLDITKDAINPVIIKYIHVVNGNKIKSDVIRFDKGAKRIRFRQTDTGLSLQLDEDSISSFLTNCFINTSLPIALHITNKETTECHFLVLSNIGDINCYGSHNNQENCLFSQSPEPNLPYSYRKGILERVKLICKRTPSKRGYNNGDAILNLSDNYIYTFLNNRWCKKTNVSEGDLIVNEGDNYTYLAKKKSESNRLIFERQSQTPKEKIETISQYERFELRKVDCHSARDDRSERAEIRLIRSNLRVRHISFDVFLPIDYNMDVRGGESIFQTQLTPDFPNEARVPAFVLSTELFDGSIKWTVSSRSINSKFVPGEKIVRDDDIIICDCFLGGWTHWEFYIKEGYESGHMPCIRVMKDGELVWESYKPNTWNDVYGTYIRYGVYKSEYLSPSLCTKTSKRVVYIANFKYFS